MKKMCLVSLNRKKGYKTQLDVVFEYLFHNVATASMVEWATNIPQKNICRYKRYLQKRGKLWEIVKQPCERTRRDAWYITTNKDLVVL